MTSSKEEPKKRYLVVDVDEAIMHTNFFGDHEVFLADSAEEAKRMAMKKWWEEIDEDWYDDLMATEIG